MKDSSHASLVPVLAALWAQDRAEIKKRAEQCTNGALNRHANSLSFNLKKKKNLDYKFCAIWSCHISNKGKSPSPMRKCENYLGPFKMGY